MIHHKRRTEMVRERCGHESVANDSREKPALVRLDAIRSRANAKNFFVAKNRDSESVQRPFRTTRGAATNSAKDRSMNAQVAKNPTPQAFPATLMFARYEFSRIPSTAAKRVCRADHERASRDVGSSRKHFLKRDTVFFEALVYSGCSAFRFPNARSEKPSHYIRRATWRRRLERKRRVQ
jgi:hypothetical protein